MNLNYKGTPVYTIEEITLSDYIQSQLNRDWLSQSLKDMSQDYCGLGFFSRKKGKVIKFYVFIKINEIL